MANNITWSVGLDLDEKGLQSQLSRIRNDIQNAITLSGQGALSDEIINATSQAKALGKALQAATNEKGISLRTFNVELAKAGTTATKMAQTLISGGTQFSGSLNVALETMSAATNQANKLTGALKDAAHVFVQSFKFSAAQNLIRGITSGLQSGIRYTKELNEQLTQISIVSGKAGTSLDHVYKTIAQGAQELKIAAKDYAEAAQIFYQQGLDESEVERRTEITIKAAKAAGQSVEEMSSQLTAIWNTYKMSGDELERSASVAARLGAETAIEFKDIAEAMQSSASAASTMGVSYDSLAAIISTVGTVTQQSASIIGNAYKTIFSRFEQLKAGGSDGEVTLNRVSAQLDQLGITVIDQYGNLKDLDSVITELGNNWATYSKKQQVAIAETVGGTRQYTQFLALMNNFDEYQKNLASASNEDGSALARQYATYQNGIEAAQKRMSESWRKSFGSLFDEDLIKKFYNTLEAIGKLVGYIFDGAGGFTGILSTLAAVTMPKITNELTIQYRAFKEMRKEAKLLKMNSAERQVALTQPLYQQQKATYENTQSNIRDNSSNLTLNGELQALDASNEAVKKKIELYGQVKSTLLEIEKISKHGTIEEVQYLNAIKDNILNLQKVANSSADANAKGITQAGQTLMKRQLSVKANTANAYRLSNSDIKVADKEFLTTLGSIDTGKGTLLGKAGTLLLKKNSTDAYKQAVLTLNEIGSNSTSVATKIENLNDAFTSGAVNLKNMTAAERNVMMAMKDTIANTKQARDANIQYAESVKAIAIQERDAAKQKQTNKASMSDQLALYANLYSSVNMMAQALGNLSTAIIDVAVNGEDGTKILFAIVGLIPAVIMGIVMIRAQLKKLDMTLKEMMASNPFTAALLIISLVITAIVKVVQAVNEYRKKQAEAAQSQVQSLTALNETLKEQTEVLKDNVKSWKDAIAAGEDASEAYEKIAESVENITAAMRELGLSTEEIDNALLVAASTGDTTQLDTAIQNAQEQTNNAILEKSKKAYEKTAKTQKTVSNYNTGSYDAITGEVSYESVGRNSSAAEIRKFYQDAYKQSLSNDEATAKNGQKVVDGLSEVFQQLEEILDQQKTAFEALMGNYFDDQSTNFGTNDFSNNVQALGDIMATIQQEFSDSMTPEEMESYMSQIIASNSDLARTFKLLEKANNFAAVNGWESKDIQNYVNGLTKAEQDLLLKVDVSYVDDLNGLERILEGQKEFEATINVNIRSDASLEESIAGYNKLQDNLKAALSDNDSQGYVSTDTAYEMIQAGQGDMLTTVGDKFYITKTAADEYTASLEKEFEATKQLLENSRSLVSVLPDMGAQLKNMQDSIGEGGPFEGMITAITDMLSGDSDTSLPKMLELLNTLQTEIEAIDFSQFSGKELGAVTEGIANTIEGIASMQSKLDAAFKSGQVSGKEYAQATGQIMQNIIDGSKVEAEAIKAQEAEARESGDEVRANSLKDQYDALTESINKATKKQQEFNKALSFVGQVSDNYDELIKYLDDDFTIRPDVDFSQVYSKSQILQDTARAAFESLGEDVTKTLGYGVEDLANLTEVQFNDLMQKAGQNANNQISTTGQAISSILKNIGNVLDNINYEFSVTAKGGGSPVMALLTGQPVSLTASNKGTSFSNATSDAANFFADWGGTADYTKLSTYRQSKGTSTIGTNGKESATKDPTLVRYENWERQLEVINTLLERTAKAADKAYGNKKVQLLDNYNKRLAYQAKLQQELLDKAKEYYQSDKEALVADKNNAAKAQFVTVDGVETLQNAGDLRNYWETFKANTKDEYASAYAEKQLKILDNYLESVSKIQEALDTQAENLDKYLSNELEKLHAMVDLEQTLWDINAKQAENLLKLLANGGKTTAEYIKSIGDNMASAVKQANLLNGAANAALNIQKDPSAFKDKFGEDAYNYYLNTGQFDSTVLAQLTQDASELQNLQAQIIEYDQQMASALSEAYSTMIDDFSNLNSKLDRNLKTIKSWRGILEALGYDKADSDSYLKTAQAELDTTAAQLKVKQEELELAKKYNTEAQKNLAAFQGDKNSENYKLLKDAADEASAAVDEANNSILELKTSIINAVKEITKVAAEAQADAYARSQGFYDYAGMSTAYSQATTMRDLNLTEVNKDYGLDKLERSTNTYLSDSMLSGSQMKKYQDFLDKVNAKKAEGVKMTQEELDILNAEFELMKAEDAYEEAKNAKNTMRLTRDASGNYSYVYSADTGKVSEAEQALEDAKNKLYNLKREFANSSEELYKKTLDEFKEFTANIDIEKYNSDSNYKAQCDATHQYYMQLLDEYAGRVTMVYSNFEDRFDESALGIITDTQNMGDAHEELSGIITKMTEASTQSWQDNKANIDAATAGIIDDNNSVADSTYEMAKDIAASNESISTSANNLRTTYNSALSAIASAQRTWATTTVSNNQSVIDSINATINAIKALAAAQGTTVESSEPTVTTSKGTDVKGAGTTTVTTGGTGGTGGSGGGGGGGGGGGTVTEYVTVTWNAGGGVFPDGTTTFKKQYVKGHTITAAPQYPTRENANFKQWSPELGRRGLTVNSDTTITAIWSPQYAVLIGDNHYLTTDAQKKKIGATTDYYVFDTKAAAEAAKTTWSNKLFTNGDKASIKAAFKTGGYTEHGGIALLHDKEIVLNRDDTANILAAVNGMRSIVGQQLTNKGASVGTIAPTVSGSNTLDQNVHIDANFPNVSMASEIEDAFNNLINRAAQYNLK